MLKVRFFMNKGKVTLEMSSKLLPVHEKRSISLLRNFMVKDRLSLLIAYWVYVFWLCLYTCVMHWDVFSFSKSL